MDQPLMNNHANQPTYDVIISGAGPVGLFLACELALAKCSVLILEKTENPHSPLKLLPFGILVRPDGFIAWASDSEPDEQSIRQAVSLWFGSCATKGTRSCARGRPSSVPAS